MPDSAPLARGVCSPSGWKGDRVSVLKGLEVGEVLVSTRGALVPTQVLQRDERDLDASDIHQDPNLVAALELHTVKGREQGDA